MSQPAVRPLALVTGASSGIGRELAKQFAEHGFDLIVAAEDVELDDAIEELRAYGGAVAPVSVDLTIRADVERLVAAVRGAGRPLDVAALNAGVGHGGRFVLSLPREGGVHPPVRREPRPRPRRACARRSARSPAPGRAGGWWRPAQRPPG